jgi:hypothetical protein
MTVKRESRAEVASRVHAERLRQVHRLHALGALAHRSGVGVAEWETKIVDKLPKDLEGSLPTIEQIEAELASTVPPKRKQRATSRNR